MLTQLPLVSLFFTMRLQGCEYALNVIDNVALLSMGLLLCDVLCVHNGIGAGLIP